MKKYLFTLLFGAATAVTTAMPPAADWVRPGQEEGVGLVQVETPPRFRDGGIDGFRRWVEDNIRYTERLQQADIHGRVTVKFVVERNGKIGPIEVMQSPHEALSREVVRVMRRSPRWTPGRQGDRPVRVMFVLPVIFEP